ncbi:hypothetical protein HK102_010385 [Quaeritorhiza haematococci]|nr:hypothetical protein HK102_010385 [Quaeritorhiza haematococci]
MLEALSYSGDNLIHYNTLAYALQCVGFFASAILVGALSDRFNNHRKSIFVAASILFATSIAVLAFAENASAYLGANFGFGICEGTVFNIGNTIVADVFPPSHHGRKLAYTLFAYMLGKTVGPVIGGLMGDTVGLHAPLYLSLALSILDIFFRFLMDPKSHKPVRSNQQSSPVTDILKVPSFYMVSVVNIFVSLTEVAFESVYAIHLIEKFQMSTSDVGLTTLAYTIPSTALSIIVGHLADKYPKHHIVSAGLLLHAVSAAVVFIAPTNPATTCIAFAAFGASFSVAFSPMYPLMLSMADNANLVNVAGKMSALDGLVSGIGQIIGPLLINASESDGVFFLVVGCVIAGFVPIFAVQQYYFFKRGRKREMGVGRMSMARRGSRGSTLQRSMSRRDEVRRASSVISINLSTDGSKDEKRLSFISTNSATSQNESFVRSPVPDVFRDSSYSSAQQQQQKSEPHSSTLDTKPHS